MPQYFVAIVLPQELDKKIIVFKQMMLEKYQCTVGLKSPAHITLLPPFWMDENKETKLLDLLSPLKNQRPFEISTTGFSSFPPKTIFIDIEPSEQLLLLKNDISRLFSGFEHIRIKPDTRNFHPHITIATRDLHKKSFYETQSYFENKTFREMWTANGFSLLRHNGKIWEVIRTERLI